MICSVLVYVLGEEYVAHQVHQTQDFVSDKFASFLKKFTLTVVNEGVHYVLSAP